MCNWLKRKQQEIGILRTEQPKTTKMERNVYKTTTVKQITAFSLFKRNHFHGKNIHVIPTTKSLSQYQWNLLQFITNHYPTCDPSVCTAVCSSIDTTKSKMKVTRWCRLNCTFTTCISPTSKLRHCTYWLNCRSEWKFNLDPERSVGAI